MCCVHSPTGVPDGKEKVVKTKPMQRKRRVTTASDLSPLTPSLNDLVNALDVALHKDGIHAVMERLDFELGIHAMELEDKKPGLGNLTTYELIQSLERKSKTKRARRSDLSSRISRRSEATRPLRLIPRGTFASMARKAKG